MKKLLLLSLSLFFCSGLIGQACLDLGSFTSEKNNKKDLVEISPQKIEPFFNTVLENINSNPSELEITIRTSNKKVRFNLDEHKVFKNIRTTIGTKETFETYQLYNAESDDKRITVIENNGDLFVEYADTEMGYNWVKSKLKNKNRFSFRSYLNEKTEEHICGNCSVPNAEKLSSSMDIPLKGLTDACTGNNEFEFSVGVACDFSYFLQNSSNLIMTIGSMLGSLDRAADEYGKCDMRVILTLGGISIETSLHQFYLIGDCLWPLPSGVDALRYNQVFANSPSLPDGDVATLWTSRDLRGFSCVGNVFGMANWIGGACNSNRTNVCESLEGIVKGRLQAHEIGHNIGVGLFHGNVPPGYFYNAYGSEWHYSTIATIHSTLKSKSCVDEFVYCCKDLRNVYLCDNETSFCIDLPSCGGNYTSFNGTISGNQLCGSTGFYTVRQSTGVLDCNFNIETFKVVDCEGSQPTYSIPPYGMHQICHYEVEPVCFEFECVDSWEIQHSSDFFIETDGDRICIASSGKGRTGQKTITLRPHYSCGGVGNWVTWTIDVVDCEFGQGGGQTPIVNEEDINIEYFKKSRQNLLGATSKVPVVKSEIYPNPALDQLNIKPRLPIRSVEIYNSNGQLLKTSNQKEIDLKDIEVGILIVKIILEDNSIEQHRIVKID